ncbi:hypothetical protein D3C80_1767430 [compost metagenome]
MRISPVRGDGQRLACFEGRLFIMLISYHDMGKSDKRPRMSGRKLQKCFNPMRCFCVAHTRQFNIRQIQVGISQLRVDIYCLSGRSRSLINTSQLT